MNFSNNKQKEAVRKAIIIFSVIALMLAVLAAALWLMPAEDKAGEYSYGSAEGMELTRQDDGSLIVKDKDGNTAFPVPLRGCIIDNRFRGGKLRFREKVTGREGFIDRHGIVTFLNTGTTPNLSERHGAAPTPNSTPKAPNSSPLTPNPTTPNSSPTTPNSIKTVDLRTMARNNPFYKEAAKILQGKLNENDASHRHTILNYCEHFRTAYTTKDIDFLRQVFSDDALIIVGNVVKPSTTEGGISGDSRVTYALHTKKDYLERLSKVFNANKKIDVRFSDFRIMRHPTRDGIYGVTLRQHYKSDRYEDDGWLFLLWDFRNPSMPMLHVRTWQQAKNVNGSDDLIGISDFNLE